MRCLITGANGVFGYHIAQGMAHAGFETHLVVRDLEKGRTLISRLVAAGVSEDLLTLHVVDLHCSKSIEKLASNFSSEKPIDVLINNAAATSPQRVEVQGGVEMQWSANVLSYHRMTRAFLPHLLASKASPARCIFVASNYAGGLNVKDPEFKARAYDGDAAYRASKQANRMLARSWADKAPAEKLCVFSCHPGVATSAVSLGLGFDLDRSTHAAKAGSVTPLFLALTPIAQLANGCYYSDSKIKGCAFCEDDPLRRELWGLVESYA